MTELEFVFVLILFSAAAVISGYFEERARGK